MFFLYFLSNFVIILLMRRDLKMKKVLKISVGLLSALLLGCYGAGCYYFQSHYYYGTTIEGRLYRRC